MVDKSVVYRIMGSLNDSLAHLESKRNVSFEAYRKDRDVQAIVERKLEISIQACIDMGNHIVSPGKFRQSFRLRRDISNIVGKGDNQSFSSGEIG